MTTPHNGEFIFKSPINKENSFGAWNLAEETESTISVNIPEDGRGCFTWDVPELDEYEEGELNFEGNTLVDYDGVFELPQQLIDYLNANGYNTDEI
jgi:hypothetical protein